jgi:diguanylate cyclase (GGDEF)-like protein
VLIAWEAEQSSFFYRQSITDGLTGLYKNTYLVKVIDEMEPPYAVAMVDGDHFKDINDRWGHPIGNQVLIHIAKLLRHTVREKDVIARYGGDEFLVLLRDCSHQGAVACMERFRERIQDTPLETENRTISITVSIGLCHSNRKMSSGELISQADKALYKAKKTGRNRLCAVEMGREEVWSEEPGPA